MSINKVGWLTKEGSVILKTIINSQDFRAHRDVITEELTKYFPEKSALVIQQLPDMGMLIDKDMVVDEDPYYHLKIKLVNTEEIIKANKVLDKLIAGIKTVGNTIPDDNLRMPSEDEIKKAIKKIKETLLISEETIKQIISSLVAGQHIILTGPVGTGKTELASLLPELVWNKGEYHGYYSSVYTANAEWTTQDVIGGIVPKVIDEEENKISYRIQDGCVTKTVKNNYDKLLDRHDCKIENKEYLGEWLVIDEFNRADIDRAFGPLFTIMGNDKKNNLQYPTTKPNDIFDEITIPKDYRIIGTLNTFDRHFLHTLSYALKRRFDMIEMGIPTLKEIDSEKKIVREKMVHALASTFNKEEKDFLDELQKNGGFDAIDNLFEIMSFIRQSKELGTAILISMTKLMVVHYQIVKDWDVSLDAALTSNVTSQIDGLSTPKLEIIQEFCRGNVAHVFANFDTNERENDIPEYANEMRKILRYINARKLKRTVAEKCDILYANENLAIDPADPVKLPIVGAKPSEWVNKFQKGDIFRIKNDAAAMFNQFIVKELEFDFNIPWVSNSPPKVPRFNKSLDKLIKQQEFGDIESFEEDTELVN